jgi:hypothetical protein
MLVPQAIADIATLGLFPGGSRLVVALMTAVQDTGTFQQFTDAVFTDANIVDCAVHKLVLAVAAAGIVETDFIIAALDRVGMAEVLRSPGASIVAELTRKAPEFERRVKALISAEGITGKAIEAILNPINEYEIDRQKAFRKRQK